MRLHLPSDKRRTFCSSLLVNCQRTKVVGQIRLYVCVIYSSWVWLGPYRGFGPEWSLQRDFRGENWFFSADGTKSPAMSSGLKVWLTSPSNESLFCSRYASQDVRFQISQLNPTPTSTTSFSKPAQSAESFGIRIRFCLSNSQNDARA